MTDKIKCTICGRDDFKSQYGLTQHVESVHPDYESAEKNVTTPIALPGPGGGAGDTKSPAKAQPLDLAISHLRVPMVPEQFNGAANIYWSGFNEGVSYGANTILAGIRAAQDLSSLGIAQATPIIKMAQEMRQSEGQAARIIATELAQATLESNREGNREIMAALNKQTTAQNPNPMLMMMTQAMSPMFQQVLGNLVKMVQPQVGQPLTSTTQPDLPRDQQPMEYESATEEEVKEAFQ
jgi:hypothetical protein